MKKDTRNYRKNFASGGWVPPPNAEDAAGNPTRGYYDTFGRFKHGESPAEQTKFTLAHPGRTVPNYDRLVDVYPTGSHKQRQKLEKAVEAKYKRTGDAFGYSGSGSSSELYGGTTPDTAERMGYNKGGVVRKRR